MAKQANRESLGSACAKPYPRNAFIKDKKTRQCAMAPCATTIPRPRNFQQNARKY